MQQQNIQKVSRTMMYQLVDLIFDKKSESLDVPSNSKTELLEDKLREIVTDDVFDKSNLPDHLLALCSISGVSKGENLKSVIKNDKVELGLLTKIKDYFKELSSKSDDIIEHQVYNAIYFAFIACALLYHQKKISSYSYEKLGLSYSRLLKEDWLPDYIQKLYLQAKDYCDSHLRK